MNQNIAKGWKTFADVAEISGADLEAIERWAGDIEPGGLYSPDGRLYDDVTDEEKTAKGRDIVRKMDGQFVMCDAAVDVWQTAEERVRELTSQGWLTIDEAAEEIGISRDQLDEDIREESQGTGNFTDRTLAAYPLRQS